MLAPNNAKLGLTDSSCWSPPAGPFDTKEECMDSAMKAKQACFDCCWEKFEKCMDDGGWSDDKKYDKCRKENHECYSGGVTSAPFPDGTCVGEYNKFVLTCQDIQT